MRDFNLWLSKFRESICDYSYYVDFDKVYRNVEKMKIELNLLNSLIGARNIETDFDNLINKYPEVLKCIPILLAVRQREIYVIDKNGEYNFSFIQKNYTNDEYKMFMRKTGLFDLLQNRIIGNLLDYVTGVEVGLDSNGRKNRGGKIMENLVESYIVNAGYVLGQTYFKQMYLSDIEKKWGLNLSAISNNGQAEKKFDFVVKSKEVVYAIEVNFYSTSGSKLNETARSYKMIAEEAKNIPNFKFVWFTDGVGWRSAKNNLKETFDVLDTIYNIEELESGVIERIFD